MTGPARLVVVGGGLAATRLVEELRRLGGDGEITLVAAEGRAPYDRPPLSKEVLRGTRDETPLRDDWSDLQVDLQLGRRGVALRPSERTVLLDDGRVLAYDALVVATGAAPRKLPGVSGTGVHELRTLEDSRGLAADIRGSGRLTVVGGGFIGCEVASSALAMGAQVTLVELLATPLARVLGAQVGAEIAALHVAAGVDVRCGISVVEAQHDAERRELLLSDGSRVAGFPVLVGLGVLPSTGWLDGSGLEVADGVVCDEHGRTSAPGVWAAGDAARWRHPLYDEHLRIEHWTSAAGQGEAVARDLVGQPQPMAEVPYFWSDQQGVKLQLLGRPHPDDDVELLRVGKESDRLLAVYGRDGTARAVLGISAARWVMSSRPLLEAGASTRDVVAALTA